MAANAEETIPDSAEALCAEIYQDPDYLFAEKVIEARIADNNDLVRQLYAEARSPAWHMSEDSANRFGEFALEFEDTQMCLELLPYLQEFKVHDKINEMIKLLIVKKAIKSAAEVKDIILFTSEDCIKTFVTYNMLVQFAVIWHDIQLMTIISPMYFEDVNNEKMQDGRRLLIEMIRNREIDDEYIVWFMEYIPMIDYRIAPLREAIIARRMNVIRALLGLPLELPQKTCQNAEGETITYTVKLDVKVYVNVADDKRIMKYCVENNVSVDIIEMLLFAHFPPNGQDAASAILWGKALFERIDIERDRALRIMKKILELSWNHIFGLQRKYIASTFADYDMPILAT